MYKIFLFIFLSFFIQSVYGQQNERTIDRLKLVNNVNTFKETTITVQKGLKQILSKDSIVFYKDGGLKYSVHINYKNDTISSISKLIGDAHGNITETFFYSPKSLLKTHSVKTYDANNQCISLRSEESTKTINITYKNKYDAKERLVEVRLSGQNGEFERRTYEYDKNNKVIREDISNSWLKATNMWRFEKNNLVEYKHIRNGVVEDHYKNTYQNGLLVAEEKYTPDGQKQSEKLFTYNDDKLLFSEKNSSFGDEIKYTNYDKHCNWLHQERDFTGIKYIVDRTISYYP
jgi:hypothetical protein